MYLYLYLYLYFKFDKLHIYNQIKMPLSDLEEQILESEQTKKKCKNVCKICFIVLVLLLIVVFLTSLNVYYVQNDDGSTSYI